MASVDCKNNGSNIYEGLEVVVIYYNTNSFEWVFEEGTVENGAVELSTSGPITNQKYWIGKKYSSVMETLPIKGSVGLNKTARSSHVDLYLRESQEGSVEVINSDGTSRSADIEYDDTELFSGKKRVNVGSRYSDEISVKIVSSGYRPFHVLALDVDLNIFEK